MKTDLDDNTKEKFQEETKQIESISSEDENSENNDQNDNPKNNLASFITTPYERVLSIINEAKAFILSVSSSQQNLVKGLEWAIKVISSHNLYIYELKDHEENEEYKQFVQFMNSYNDVIPTLKKPIGKKSFLFSSLYLKRPTTFKYSINKIEEEKLGDESDDKVDKDKNKKINENPINKDKNNNVNTTPNKKEIINTDVNTANKNNKEEKKNKNNNKATKKKTKLQEIRNKFFKNNINNLNNNNINKEILRNLPKNNKQMKKLEKSENSKTQKFSKNQASQNNLPRSEKKAKPLSPIRQTKKSENNVLTPKSEIKTKPFFSPNPKKTQSSKENNYFPKSSKNIKTFHKMQTLKIPSKKLSEENPINLEESPLNRSFTHYSSNLIENALIDINYPPGRIIEKTFNIFELKEIIGQDNVLPIMGKVILDSFGLYSDEIISKEKLDPFLVSISNQYYKTTLYHNSMHGADVTQSLCLYFLNSNAEEICQSLVLDLLGILISALGHDLGHPGLTNPFHINSSSELAITYNDVSCLENFHASKLFRTIRNPETDIFEKLSVQDYKTIRKRMIGNILATDMANHGKIMTLIKSRIAINKAENKTKFELLSGNEKTKFEEQQSLFDFLIHAADLAHNTKLFNISLKWVELLSEEFWLQGDKEKSMNLPVSFLCDRDNYNIPQSQVGFIRGFIIPTFDCLIDIFPSLKFTMDNAKTNLKKWEKLVCKGRLKGWTPEKTKQVNYKKKMILFSAISSISENNNSNNIKMLKRKSGNVNSLSHALQVKENNTKENNKDITQNEKGDKKNNKDGKSKMQRPNIIMKSKNHDKKINLHRLQKFK